MPTKEYELLKLARENVLGHKDNLTYYEELYPKSKQAFKEANDNTNFFSKLLFLSSDYQKAKHDFNEVQKKISYHKNGYKSLRKKFNDRVKKYLYHNDQDYNNLCKEVLKAMAGPIVFQVTKTEVNSSDMALLSTKFRGQIYNNNHLIGKCVADTHRGGFVEHYAGKINPFGRFEITAQDKFGWSLSGRGSGSRAIPKRYIGTISESGQISVRADKSEKSNIFIADQSIRAMQAQLHETTEKRIAYETALSNLKSYERNFVEQLVPHEGLV